ncbi:MAG TPA: hypothetical protein VFB62_23920, partial [Polyangiaceae bacterium]|nr:hypothetical protein [Polyangiaceae bacterium]
PEYMSPEMILGRRETDPYADLWSLAVVAYHALARELPFDGDTAREIVLRVVTKPHRPLSDVRDDVTSELDAWFERALSKDVTKRFASARELASAFVAAVDTRRPSLRFSHPDLTLAEDGTLPGFQVDQAPTLQRPRPALSSDRGSDRGTIRIHEKFTPNGTAVIPRERDPESGPHTSAPVSSSVSPPDSLPPPVSSPRIRLSLLLAGVSVVSALLTLLCIRLFSDPVASAATSQLVPGALPQTQAAPIQSERASTPPSASPSASASASRPPADKKTLGAPALSTDYGF